MTKEGVGTGKAKYTLRRIIGSIHDQAHLDRDKTLSEITARDYWPEMYNDVSSYAYLKYNVS